MPPDNRLVTRLSLILIVIAASPAAADAPGVVPRLIPPVDAAMVRPFIAPSTEYGPGHRGIDYAVAAGTRVRAAAAGTVTFAGTVAGTRAVTIDHGDGLETTYSSLSDIYVVAGNEVGAGQWIGAAAGTHAGSDEGLHFGVLVAERYVDPAPYLGAVDVGAAIHLAPLVWRPSPRMPEGFARVFTTAGDHTRDCIPAPPRSSAAEPPNDNVAVAVAGIASKTAGGVDAEIYQYGPELLGFPAERVYEFSYRGSAAPSLHEPYERSDTFGDLNVAAARLTDLLTRVAERHPGAGVDLIAHSQGGVVARLALEGMAEDWDGALPRVEHLITFSSPHSGAPLAGLRSELARSPVGRAALEAASFASEHGAPWPDPDAPAVAQLAPGSPVIAGLAEEDVAFGTRVLTLAIPNDVIVPADRAGMRGELGRVVPPAGLNGHAGIVSSPVARGIAYDFLRDRPEPCAGAWDVWGPRVGRVVSFAESRAGRAVGAADRLLWPGIAWSWP